MATRVFKNLALNSELIEQIDALVRANGGRAKGATFSGEVNRLLRMGLQQHVAGTQAGLMAPVMAALLDEKVRALEDQLKPLAYVAAHYAAIGTLLGAELFAGNGPPRRTSPAGGRRCANRTSTPVG